MRVDPEKLNTKFHLAEELMTEYIGPAGSPEREEMEAKAKAWFYGEILRECRKLRWPRKWAPNKVISPASRKAKWTYNSPPCSASPEHSVLICNFNSHQLMFYLAIGTSLFLLACFLGAIRNRKV